jgi:hypothetical protein
LTITLPKPEIGPITVLPILATAGGGTTAAGGVTAGLLLPPQACKAMIAIKEELKAYRFLRVILVLHNVINKY